MKTIVDLMNVTANGAVEVRLKKFDGTMRKERRKNATGAIEEVDVENFRYHRLVIEPGEDAEARLADVNAHIQSLSDNLEYVEQHGRHAACPPAEIQRVKAVCVEAHTPERIARHRQATERHIETGAVLR